MAQLYNMRVAVVLRTLVRRPAGAWDKRRCAQEHPAQAVLARALRSLCPVRAACRALPRLGKEGRRL